MRTVSNKIYFTLLLVSCLICIVATMALWAYAATAEAQTFGQDYLGGAKFASAIIANHPRDQAAGFFSYVDGFGDALPVAESLAKKGVPLIRLELQWRDDHNFQEKDFAFSVKEAKRACPLTKKYPAVKWHFSGACEHKMNSGLAQKLAQQVSAACPTATYVNVPLPQGAVLPNYINESHGGGRPRSGKFAFSFDGTAAEDANVEAVKQAFRGAEYFLMWGPRYNGRWATNDSTPRQKRKGYADANYIKGELALTKPKGPTSLPAKHLWKSMSENKGNGDPRAGKPVAIMPIKTNQLVLKKNNKVISGLAYYAPYQDGRSRYYADQYGYQLTEKCEGVCDLWANGKRLGAVNPAFRENEYR